MVRDEGAAGRAAAGEGGSGVGRGGRGRSWLAGAPASAFIDAVQGARGWGLRAADGAFAAFVLLVALAVCFVLWFAYGARGVPGVSTGSSDVAGGSAAASGADQASENPLYAVVQNTEGIYQVLPLDEDATLTVTGSLGTNVIEVRGGRVRCPESDCANQVCVDAGWICDAGQMIVCLPHKLTVQVVADPADASSLL